MCPLGVACREQAGRLRSMFVDVAAMGEELLPLLLELLRRQRGGRYACSIQHYPELHVVPSIEVVSIIEVVLDITPSSMLFSSHAKIEGPIPRFHEWVHMLIDEKTISVATEPMAHAHR